MELLMRITIESRWRRRYLILKPQRLWSIGTFGALTHADYSHNWLWLIHTPKKSLKAKWKMSCECRLARRNGATINLKPFIDAHLHSPGHNFMTFSKLQSKRGISLIWKLEIALQPVLVSPSSSSLRTQPSGASWVFGDCRLESFLKAAGIQVQAVSW